LYDKVEVYDERLPKEEFDNVLKVLGLWETSCRLGKFESAVNRGKEITNKFYLNLIDIILAYNFRLHGYKKEAYDIVKNNNTDLGLIYRQRWENK
jgi:hypothetical protein